MLHKGFNRTFMDKASEINIRSTTFRSTLGLLLCSS